MSRFCDTFSVCQCLTGSLTYRWHNKRGQVNPNGLLYVLKSLNIFGLVNNNNLFDVVVDYTDGGSYSGSVIIGSQQIQQIFIPKQSVCQFSYHFNLFRQVLTNDQLCSETQLLKQYVFMTATGKIASDKMMYRIENGHRISSANIEISCGSTIYPYTRAPKSVAYFACPLAEALISISAEPFAVSSPSFTLNGTITNNAYTDGSVDYYCVYGTDPGNLNQSTATQNTSVSAQNSVNVSAAISGLTTETLYYYKLVAATNQSSAKKIF